MVKQNENVETKAKTEIEAEIKTEAVQQPIGNKSQSQLAIEAADRDGYDQLETLFAQAKNKLMFNFEENHNTDELGNKRSWISYYASHTDDDGFEWQVPVRPIRASDKSLMENYLRFMKHELQKAKA